MQVAAGQRERQLFAVPFPAGGRAEPLQMLAASDRAVGGFLNRVLNKNTVVIGGGELGPHPHPHPHPQPNPHPNPHPNDLDHARRRERAAE